MARVNITLPDGLLQEARAADLNVSGVAAAGLAEELDRRRKLEALDRYLAELDVELGPIPADERATAERWVGQLDDGPQRRTA